MNHVFCTECGNKIGFLHAKPNFCSKCGSSTSASLKTNKYEAEEEESLRDDETSVQEVPDIHKLDVDVEQYRDNVFSFGSLAGESPRETRSRNKGSRNIEDFIDDKRRR